MLVIRKIRRDRDITQKQLAERLGTRQQTVAMWERGHNEPRAAMIPKIAEALGCTVADLYGEKPLDKSRRSTRYDGGAGVK